MASTCNIEIKTKQKLKQNKKLNKNFLSKSSAKTVTWKLVLGSFVFAKNELQPLLENEIFWRSMFILDM